MFMLTMAFTSKWSHRSLQLDCSPVHKKLTNLLELEVHMHAAFHMHAKFYQKTTWGDYWMRPDLVGELYTAGSHYQQPLHNSLDLLTSISATSARGWLICICFGTKGNHVVAALHFFWKVRRRWLTHSWPPVVTITVWNSSTFLLCPSLCHLFSLGTAIEPS